MATTAPSFEAYMFHLLEGRRQECRRIFDAFRALNSDATRLFTDLLWPAMESVARLYKEDRINTTVEHMATRINRQLADRVRQYMHTPTPSGKRLILLCGDGEPEELGAQMTADLFETQGWEVFFIGGGVPRDEIIALLGQLRPDILMIFGTTPQGVPGARRLIDHIRELGTCPTMNILVSGGVFNRAHGLWEEINADLFAPTAAEALKIAADALPRTAQPCNPGGPKKRRRRRRSPYMPAATT
ncbi:MAG: cobalamin-dependent protein [Phycisphaerales bacterium]|nr:MAG: cobalamin-dependent protein [Phycisphaerales bacterium]